MSGRVREDPPAAGVDVEQRGAEAEDLFLGLVEVRDLDIQMKLLRARRIRPLRGVVFLRTLEREYEAKVGVQGREVLAHCPPGIRLIDLAAKKCLVEHGELQDIRAVQDHALEPADHRCSAAAAMPVMVSRPATRPQQDAAGRAPSGVSGKQMSSARLAVKSG